MCVIQDRQIWNGRASTCTNIIKQYGFIPEEVYNGNEYRRDKHNHAEDG